MNNSLSEEDCEFGAFHFQVFELRGKNANRLFDLDGKRRSHLSVFLEQNGTWVVRNFELGLFLH